jgi:hypothetical protein
MVALQVTETVPFGPFGTPYTCQIHVRSVARTPFQTVSLLNSRKFGLRIRFEKVLRHGSLTVNEISRLLLGTLYGRTSENTPTRT